jgi:hypothetical protein
MQAQKGSLMATKPTSKDTALYVSDATVYTAFNFIA